MIQHNLTTSSYYIHPKLSLLVLLKFYCINKIFKLNTNLSTASLKEKSKLLKKLYTCHF